MTLGKHAAPCSAMSRAVALIVDEGLSMTEVTLAGTEQFILRRNNGRGDHLVQVAPPLVPPNAPPPPDGYGVVIVLDGEHLFGTAFEAARMRTLSGAAPPTVVIGLSYPDHVLANMRHRAFDFTPPTPSDKYPHDAPMIGTEFGGAAAFLDFILGDLWAAVSARWPVNPQDRTLVGYSLGGVFALNALFNRPQAFRTVCALSPSIWWNDFELLDTARSFATERASGAPVSSVLLTAGGREQDAPLVAPPGVSLEVLAERTRAARMVEAAFDMGALLDRAGIDVETLILDGEDHGSVIPAALGRALRFSVERGRRIEGQAS
jgi:predicted alpha/beta superfamily hydrolase